MFKELKEKLQELGGANNFILLVKFKNCTQNGDINYYINLLGKTHENKPLLYNWVLIDTLKNKGYSVKLDKDHDIIAHGGLVDYLAHYMPDLQQIKL